ncbi:Endonuclease/exonuclease/phosphatase [Corchorus capsularis]|uniref:Endonuclease/exonuclease/phosphatase n=1 Tax=Corchorus capsularis TaxID=210143 RepID=A0A1R3K2W8_COCAP|nr:Endonuclease/exonuclease/phosphatase [Corchorus capsularis]
MEGVYHAPSNTIPSLNVSDKDLVTGNFDAKDSTWKDWSEEGDDIMFDDSISDVEDGEDFVLNVTFSAEEKRLLCEPWRNALIVKLLGKFLGFKAQACIEVQTGDPSPVAPNASSSVFRLPRRSSFPPSVNRRPGDLNNCMVRFPELPLEFYPDWALRRIVTNEHDSRNRFHSLQGVKEDLQENSKKRLKEPVVEEISKTKSVACSYGRKVWKPKRDSVEPQISLLRSERLLRKLNFPKWHVSDPIGFAGGIWLDWDDDVVDISIFIYSPQLLYVEAKPKDSTKFILTVVYANPKSNIRRSLWAYMETLAQTITSPWVVLGDFNDVLGAGEKMGGAVPSFSRCNSFNGMITACGLMDLGFSSPAFTWCNRRKGLRKV